MRILYGVQTHQRDSSQPNQDVTGVRPDLGLFVLADGLGRRRAGNKAAELAVATAIEVISGREGQLKAYDDSSSAQFSLIRLVEDAVNAACRRVYEVGSTDPSCAGMGASMTLMLVAGDKAVMGHVGLCRLYLHRDGRLHQLSRDHSYVAELAWVTDTAEEVTRGGPFAKHASRALGIQDSVPVDTLLFDIVAGDRLLLCSNGLEPILVDPGATALTLTDNEPSAAASALVASAVGRGTRDDATAMALRIQPTEEDENTAQIRRAEVSRKLTALWSVPLFSQLNLRELVMILNTSKIENRLAGDVIVEEGHGGDVFYVTVSGQLAVSRGGTEIARLGPGAHFGEMSLFSGRPRSATVTATAPARMMAIHRSQLANLINEHPTLGVKLLWSFAQALSARLDEADNRLMAITKPPVWGSDS